jgi:hypothetical protein
MSSAELAMKTKASQIAARDKKKGGDFALVALLLVGGLATAVWIVFLAWGAGRILGAW